MTGDEELRNANNVIEVFDLPGLVLGRFRQVSPRLPGVVQSDASTCKISHRLVEISCPFGTGTQQAKIQGWRDWPRDLKCRCLNETGRIPRDRSWPARARSTVQSFEEDLLCTFPPVETGPKNGSEK